MFFCFAPAISTFVVCIGLTPLKPQISVKCCRPLSEQRAGDRIVRPNDGSIQSISDAQIFADVSGRPPDFPHPASLSGGC